ncbi:MAG: histidine phosphatase family protein [Polaromonas sp.]
MGSLYLVRHGQASFGTDDYDRLSPLGQQQSRRLGEYFKSQGVCFETALTGTLKRQQQTLASICEGMDTSLHNSLGSGQDGASGPPAPSALVHQAWPGLNEFNGTALIAEVHSQPLTGSGSQALSVPHFFDLLRHGMRQWMLGQSRPRGMPSHEEFVAGISAALAHARSGCQGNVLLVSSAGPIGAAVGHLMGASVEATIDLTLGLRNSSVTEFAFTPARHQLVTFNTLPHLNMPAHADWVTLA